MNDGKNDKPGRKASKGTVSILKPISVHYPLADWALIRMAAAEAKVSMSEWIRREADAAVERLRQGRH